MRNIRGKRHRLHHRAVQRVRHQPGGGSIDIVDEPRMQDLSVALRSDDMASFPAGKQIP